MLKHILDICGDVELRIGVETQTSNMRRVNATRNNVLDLKMTWPVVYLVVAYKPSQKLVVSSIPVGRTFFFVK